MALKPGGLDGQAPTYFSLGRYGEPSDVLVLSIYFRWRPREHLGLRLESPSASLAWLVLRIDWPTSPTSPNAAQPWDLKPRATMICPRC